MTGCANHFRAGRSRDSDGAGGYDALWGGGGDEAFSRIWAMAKAKGVGKIRE